MSTTQPGLSVSDPAAYRERLFALCGGRNPLDVMAATAGQLTEIARTHPAAILKARPFPGKWTPNEVIGHLADGEWVYGYRLRLILCENDPKIAGTNQEEWVAGLRHNERDPREMVEEFAALRHWNLVQWRRLSDQDLKRAGQHNERGAESLEVMLRLTAGHDLSHLDQIQRYVRAVLSPGAI